MRLNVLRQGTGDITDNDINLAAASDAVVVGFNVRVAATRAAAAEAEGVEVRLYDIIYKLTEDMEAALAGMLEPEVVEVVEGRAEVRARSSASGRNQVSPAATSPTGRIVRGGARVYRGGQLVATDRIESLRRFRDDVREVATGYECGIGLARFHDFEEGDVIESSRTQTVVRRRHAASAVSERTRRLDQLLREEISAHHRAARSRDPRIGFVTITGVEVHRTCATPPSGCRSSATRSERRATLRALGRAMPFVRHHWARCASSASRSCTCARTTAPSGGRG